MGYQHSLRPQNKRQNTFPHNTIPITPGPTTQNTFPHNPIPLNVQSKTHFNTFHPTCKTINKYQHYSINYFLKYTNPNSRKSCVRNKSTNRKKRLKKTSHFFSTP